jgi:hypothetical protein
MGQSLRAMEDVVLVGQTCQHGGWWSLAAAQECFLRPCHLFTDVMRSLALSFLKAFSRVWPDL